MAETSSGRYVYLALADAKVALNNKVAVFAKISEVGMPKKSRGTDYVLVLKIVDGSCSSLAVNFFAESMNGLPNVKSPGDVISLHKVEVKLHCGEVYLLFNKRLSSFALFNGKSNTELTPYQVSPKYQAVADDCEILLQLRSLLLEHQSKSDTGWLKRESLLRNIESGKTFDIICKVLHLCKTSENEWMLFVWDGTDAPPTAFQTSLDAEMMNPTPLHLEPIPLSRDTLCSFPREATVIRIIAGKYFEDNHFLRNGNCWVKLCNVSFALQSGIWKGVLSSSNKLFLLSDEDDDVKYRKRIYDERCACCLARMPLASFPEPSHITETDDEGAAYSTLIDSITCSEVHKCKCVVRVVAACPWRGEDLCSPINGKYRIRLTLEDPTARIHAFIPEESGVKLFGGHPTSDELTKKMNKLLGITESGGKEGDSTSRSPPWVWCCLCTCYLDENDKWGSRRYTICDTRLVN